MTTFYWKVNKVNSETSEKFSAKASTFKALPSGKRMERKRCRQTSD